MSKRHECRIFNTSASSFLGQSFDTFILVAKNFLKILIFWTKLIFGQFFFGNSGQNPKVCPKIEILRKNRNFAQNSKFWSKIEIFLKNRNFAQTSKFCSKIEIFLSKIYSSQLIYS